MILFCILVTRYEHKSYIYFCLQLLADTLRNYPLIGIMCLYLQYMLPPNKLKSSPEAHVVAFIFIPSLFSWIFLLACSKRGFLKLWYAYHRWCANYCSVVHGFGKKRPKNKKYIKVFNKCSYTESLLKLYFHLNT
jgi:hypothetical protein